MTPNWLTVAAAGDLTERDLQADAEALAWDIEAARREMAARKFIAALQDLQRHIRRLGDQ